MTVVPAPISHHHHLPRHLPHLRHAEAVRLVVAVLLALALMLLLDGDAAAGVYATGVPQR